MNILDYFKTASLLIVFGLFFVFLLGASYIDYGKCKTMLYNTYISLSIYLINFLVPLLTYPLCSAFLTAKEQFNKGL